MGKEHFVAILAAVSYVTISNSAASADGSCDRTRFMSDDICLFFTTRDGATVYAEPDLKSSVIDKLEWTYSIWAWTGDFQGMPLGWVRHSTDEPGFTHRYTGWVPVDKLVDSNELKQVKSCWPIKRVKFSEGDAWIDVLSRTNGRYYDARDTGMTKPIGHIYYAQGIAFYAGPTTPALQAEMKDVRISEEEVSEVTMQFFAGYDPKSHELFPSGYKPDDLKVEYHSPEALKGCKAIVTKQGKKNK